RCTCTPGQRAAYLSRLSSPVMDRLDLQVLMHPVDPSKLIDGIKEEPSKAIAESVAKARDIQRERFKDIGIFCNSEMSSREMEVFCPLDDACKDVLGKIMKRSGLSARAFSRIIRIARTIADLEAVSLEVATRPDPGPILPRHLLEAASYRFLDRANIFEI
ncbi:MAG: ATP-binding protein, partial [Bacteroidales bacterium]|nr:ATP-binding protein [Bacteroidales bacterium]